jgi:hypothetical protein
VGYSVLANLAAPWRGKWRIAQRFSAGEGKGNDISPRRTTDGNH